MARAPKDGPLATALVDTDATAAEVFLANGASLETWHRRCGHLSYSTIKRIASAAKGVVITSFDEPTCETCAKIKIRSRPFGRRERAKRPGEVVHTDVVSVSPRGIRGENGYVSFIDDYL